MKHIIILGDGMADHSVKRLGGKTPLQYANTEYMDLLARNGKTGRLLTVPQGFYPGSEIANTTILGYDVNKIYEGRGPLEAASIGYNMQPEDMAIRCNIITLADDVIKNHHGGHLTTEQGDMLIKFLDHRLGNDKVKFITGIRYRHLLIIKGGSKYITCTPPQDHLNESWKKLMVTAMPNAPIETGRMTPKETADLINNLIFRSQELLRKHPFNKGRKEAANSIWPWSGGYCPQMLPLMQMYPSIHNGSVISAVDLIRGIGYYAGLRTIIIPGMTGQADTNYEGKATAAIDALRKDDFVFLHIEASDEAGHDGDLDLKLKTIEDLDKRIVRPIYNNVKNWNERVCIAILPDHPTPVEIRKHIAEPVPFLIWHRGIKADDVQTFNEISCVNGLYGLLKLNEFMNQFMIIQ